MNGCPPEAGDKILFLGYLKAWKQAKPEPIPSTDGRDIGNYKNDPY